MAGPERFASVSLEELATLLEDKDSENTKKATKAAVALFSSYLQEKGQSTDFVSLPPTELCDILKQFYVEARKKDGTQYSKSSLTAVRFGLCRFIKVTRPDVDIINGAEFEGANLVFKAKVVELKKLGMAKVEHKPSISRDDLKKLYQSEAFNVDNPRGLQNKVWFEVMLFFCRRGRENLRELTKDSFALSEDSSGRKYVFKVKDELTKNRREESEALDGGFMYERQGDPNCPVASFEKYVSKLNPSCNAFFQRPKKNPQDSIWYDNQCVGKNTLGNNMKVISQLANLSKVYTNHSIRATSITILDEAGFEARHIMSVSGHKNESSIRSYASKTNEVIKHAMSVGLSNAVSEKPRNELQVLHDITNVHEQSLSISSATKNIFSFHNCSVNITNN